jgi:Mg-chelatase subunit ChlD
MALLRLDTGLTGGKLTVANSIALLLIDTSPSMEDSFKIEQAREGAIEFAQSALARGVSTALAIFAGKAMMVCDPMTDIERFTHKIRKIGDWTREYVAGEGTDIAAGLTLANRFANHFPLKTVVIVTDGQPQDKESALIAAKNLRSRNIEIVCIGTDDADRNFLKRLAGKTGKAVHVSPGDLRRAIGEQGQLLLK